MQRSVSKRMKISLAVITLLAGVIATAFVSKPKSVNYIQSSIELNDGAWSIQCFNRAPSKSERLTVVAGLLRSDGSSDVITFPMGSVRPGKSFILAGYDKTVISVRLIRIEKR